MNYSGLIKQFWKYNEKEPLGAVAVAFYFFLLEIWEKNKECDFKLSDTEICERLKITRPTIITLRQKLNNRGMIQYQPQTGLPGRYKIIAVYSPILSSFDEPKKTFSKKQKIVKNSVPKKETIQKQILLSDNLSENKIPIPIPTSGNIPSLKEFTEYTKTLENYIPELDDLIKAKYDNWLKNGWKNNYNKPITNWKSSIKNGMVFLQSELQSNSKISSKNVLQTIHRPTSKFDE